MRCRDVARAFALGVVSLIVLSCGEPSRPVAPDSDLLSSAFGPPTALLGLLQCTPLPAATAIQTIGPAGGVIHVGPHTLVIPAGALDVPVTITAVAPSDTVNAVRFEPQGLVFDRPASLTMSYANCSAVDQVFPRRIAYTTDDLQILNLLLSVNDFASKTVTAPLRHSSDYAIAW